MARNLTDIVRARKKFLKELRPQVREIITASNRLLRDLDRVINRKRSRPEDPDLIRFLTYAQKIATELGDVVFAVEGGYVE